MRKRVYLQGIAKTIDVAQSKEKITLNIIC
jgi:hypothetical protein